MVALSPPTRSPGTTTSTGSSETPSTESSLDELGTERLLELKRSLPWRVLRRDSQVPPDDDWFTWLILAGRGWGKTRTGAEYVLDQMERVPGTRAALVAQTFDDGRDVMAEGESGIVTILQAQEMPHDWNRSYGQLFLPNGSRADIYTSEKPRSLRGPQHHVAWGDEPAQWKDAPLGDVEGTTWSNLKLGVRLGEDPRIVLTTTPRRVRLLHGSEGSPGLLGQPRVHVTRGTTYENLENLAPSFRRNVLDAYEGTRIGRQELYAEDIGDAEGALWNRELIKYRVPDQHYVGGKLMDAFQRVCIGVDPSITAGGDECGIVGAGLGYDGRGYVIDDRSIRGSPDTWARAAVKAYHDLHAGELLAEDNQGGEMVKLTIRSVDPSVNVKLVHASRSKYDRAAPVAGLYEQGRVSHVRSLPALEDEQCNWTPLSPDSPNRVDALVHVVTHLMLKSGWGSYGSGVA